MVEVYRVERRGNTFHIVYVEVVVATVIAKVVILGLVLPQDINDLLQLQDGGFPPVLRTNLSHGRGPEHHRSPILGVFLQMVVVIVFRGVPIHGKLNRMSCALVLVGHHLTPFKIGNPDSQGIARFPTEAVKAQHVVASATVVNDRDIFPAVLIHRVLDGRILILIFPIVHEHVGIRRYSVPVKVCNQVCLGVVVCIGGGKKAQGKGTQGKESGKAGL